MREEHRLEVADVFRTYGDDFLARWERVLSRVTEESLRRYSHLPNGRFRRPYGRSAISADIAPSLTTRVEIGVAQSVRAAARAQWLAEREAELLPVRVFPRGVYSASANRRPGAAECQDNLQHPLPGSCRDTADDRGGPQASGRGHRLPRRASHLGSKSPSPSAYPLRRAGRRNQSRRVAVDPLPQFESRSSFPSKFSAPSSARGS